MKTIWIFVFFLTSKFYLSLSNFHTLFYWRHCSFYNRVTIWQNTKNLALECHKSIYLYKVGTSILFSKFRRVCWKSRKSKSSYLRCYTIFPVHLHSRTCVQLVCIWGRGLGVWLVGTVVYNEIKRISGIIVQVSIIKN